MEDPQAQCIDWIQTLFGECITTQQQAWSFILGYLSIFCWLNAQIPQIIENFKLRSAASLSLPFLVNWLLGDISNLIGCILTHQLPFQLYLAIYFCIADVILFGQWIYYSYQEQKRPKFTEIAVDDLPEITEAEPHHHHHHHHHRTSSRSQSRRTTLTGSSSPTAIASDIIEDGVDNRGPVIDIEQAEPVQPLIPRPRPRRLTTTSDIAHRKSTSIVLFGLVLLTMKQTIPALQDQGAGGVFSQDGVKSDIMGRVFSRSLEGEQLLGDDPTPPADQNIIILGRIFAWVCTVFYLSSRMPQLWKNFKRKSVQGLSILMFFWAAMGNLSYSLSIINSADAVNPETRQKILREAVPYLLGSSGTLLFDVSIFGQWLYYTGKLHIFGIGHRSRRHHHRHRHYHPRQPGRSRSQSRVESMVLSPSGSQGRLYSILVNEEDEDTTGAEVSNMSSSQLLLSHPPDLEQPRHQEQDT